MRRESKMRHGRLIKKQKEMTKQNEAGQQKLERQSGDHQVWLHMEGARTGEGDVENFMHPVKSEKNNTAGNKVKENRKKKRKGGEELIVFFQCTMYPSHSLWTQELHTCQHSSAHMFLLLHDRLWRKYRKTVSVCALGGGRGRRGWSNTNKAAFPTMSSTFV